MLTFCLAPRFPANPGVRSGRLVDVKATEYSESPQRGRTSLCFFPPFPKEYFLHPARQSLTSGTTSRPLLLRATPEPGTLPAGVLQHISREMRTHLVGEWCPTDRDCAASRHLHSISHAKAQKVGFNSEFQTSKVQVASKTELVDYPGGNTGVRHSMKRLHLCP